MRRVARSRPGASVGIFAWARILRYSIWVLATLIGLDYIGSDFRRMHVPFGVAHGSDKGSVVVETLKPQPGA